MTVINMKTVDDGFYHIIAIRKNGSLKYSGTSSYNLTDGIDDIDNAIGVSSGARNFAVLTANDEIVMFGDNNLGEHNVPSGLHDIVQVDMGLYHGLSLDKAGKVSAWGNNNYDQTNVPDLPEIKKVSGGWQHSVALSTDGRVFAWGYNDDGECDIPDDLPEAIDIAAGAYFTAVLLSDGRIRIFGSIDSVNDENLEGPFVEIGAGREVVKALRPDGSVVVFGDLDDQGLTAKSLQSFKNHEPFIEVAFGYYCLFGFDASGVLYVAGALSNDDIETVNAMNAISEIMIRNTWDAVGTTQINGSGAVMRLAALNADTLVMVDSTTSDSSGHYTLHIPHHCSAIIVSIPSDHNRRALVHGPITEPAS